MSRQQLRPSQIITTFGPGSIVDLPDDSVMIAGIEHWFENYKPHRKISEPRLEATLKVHEFRTPPVGSWENRDIPYVRFPRWRVCPNCGRLSNQFPEDRKNPELAPRCYTCKIATHPTRIVVACTKGHVDDFPWYRWLHRGRNCGGGNLFLKGEGRSASLGDLKIECSCGIEPRSMSGALGKDAMAEARCACQGKRPWLNDEREQCTEPLHALQRGASNIYFSVIRSALSIPPWSDPLQAEVASWWGQFHTPPPAEIWRQIIQARFPDQNPDSVRECIERLNGLAVSKSSIRREEYEALDQNSDHVSRFFEVSEEEVGEYAGGFISRLMAVRRLREVRALVGFTRIDAPEMDPTMEIFNEEQGDPVTPARISAIDLKWLPAVENLGEGVFIRLNLDRLAKWEAANSVRRRADVLLKAYSQWRQKRGLPELKRQGPRLVLLHTLAHLFLRQLSLDCGYSSASLRERIYSDSRMAGLLIYTSTPDSDGSLGGLVRQAQSSERFDAILSSAIAAARVCSGDPLCREHEPKYTELLNGAACHSCSMVSETSCEFGNRLLDRGMLLSFSTTQPTGFFDFDTC